LPLPWKNNTKKRDRKGANKETRKRKRKKKKKKSFAAPNVRDISFLFNSQNFLGERGRGLFPLPSSLPFPSSPRTTVRVCTPRKFPSKSHIFPTQIHFSFKVYKKFFLSVCPPSPKNPRQERYIDQKITEKKSFCEKKKRKGQERRGEKSKKRKKRKKEQGLQYAKEDSAFKKKNKPPDLKGETKGKITSEDQENSLC
jgi:hypothetical protein